MIVYRVSVDKGWTKDTYMDGTRKATGSSMQLNNISGFRAAPGTSFPDESTKASIPSTIHVNREVYIDKDLNSSLDHV